MDSSEQKPKRKRRTAEEIAADKAAKEEEKRLKKGPWTLEELRAKADDFVQALPKAQRIKDRWERSKDCYVLNGEWSCYGVAEVVGSTGEVYETSLTKCTCRDFKSKRAECCKHQLCLVEYIRGDRTEEQRLKEEAELAAIREKQRVIDEQIRLEQEKQRQAEIEKLEREEKQRLELELKQKRKKKIIKWCVFALIAIVIIIQLLTK